VITFSVAILTFLMIFLYIPGFYYPMVQEKELVLAFFSIITAIFNIFLIKTKKNHLDSHLIHVFILFSLFAVFNLFLNVSADYFNFNDFTEFFFQVGFFITFYIFFSYYNKSNDEKLLIILFWFLFLLKISVFFQYSGFFIVFEKMGRSGITSTLGGVNFVSYFIYLSIIISAELFFILKKSKKEIINKKILLLDIFYSVMLIGLLGTRSIILALLFVFISSIFKIKKSKKVFVFLLFIILMGGFFNGFRKNIINESVFQRIYIWKNSSMQFLKNPFFGIGAGNFKNAWFYYHENIFSPEKAVFLPENVNAMQSHNDFLQNLSEGGIVLLLITLYLFKPIRKRTKWKFGFYFLTGFIFFAFFEFPLRIVSCSFITLILFSLYFKIEKKHSHLSNYNSSMILLFILLILNISGFFFMARKTISDYYLTAGIKHADEITKIKMFEKSISLFKNGRSFYEAANIYFNQQETDKAFDYYAWALTYSAEPAIRETLGKIALKTGNYNQALIYFEDAWKRNPARFSLLYTIAEIYKKMDYDEKERYYYNLAEEIEKNYNNGG